MHDHFAERIAWCKELRDAAPEQLDSIEKRGWRFQTQAGNSPWRDVTDEWAERERRTIEKTNRLIEGYEAECLKIRAERSDQPTRSGAL